MADDFGASLNGWENGDLTGNGVIDIGDLGIVASNFGYDRNLAPQAILQDTPDGPISSGALLTPENLSANDDESGSWDHIVSVL